MYISPFVQILILSALIRLGLIIYSEYHDANAVVKYTDVDYRVFTDAAQFLLNRDGQGVYTTEGIVGSYLNIGDPYSRNTYRYTPLLALAMTPNLIVNPSFGKVLFSTCDLVVGIMLYNLFIYCPPRPLIRVSTTKSQVENRTFSKEGLAATALRRQALLWVAGLWFFNPMVITISTRGSSEPVLGLLVIGTLSLLMKGQHNLAAILLGLSIHWKIYPVIYVTSILSYFGAFSKKAPSTGRLTRLFSKQAIIFGAISIATFAVLTASIYLIWGYPFLSHSYLYHLGRLDHRHNFSPYFYSTYLTYPGTNGEERTMTSWLSNPLLSFVPQMGLSVGSGILLGSRPSGLPFAWFVQTMIFVSFNKVCTSQYFIWYTWFLPLILPRIQLSIRSALVMIVAWVSTQAVWLAIAYSLEFLGAQVYLSLWGASVFFFITNCGVLAKIIAVI